MAVASGSEGEGGRGPPAIPRLPLSQEEERSLSVTTPLSAVSPLGPADRVSDSPANNSSASEGPGSVHTDLGDISRAATNRVLNMTHRAVKAMYASARRELEEEKKRKEREDRLKRREESRGDSFQTGEDGGVGEETSAEAAEVKKEKEGQVKDEAEV